MQINEIHSFLDFITNKEISGYIAPADKDAALDRASMWLFNEKWKYYAVNQEAQDDLAPFKKKYQFVNSTTPLGLITLPSDYLHFLSGWVVTYDNKIQNSQFRKLELVNDDEVADKTRSQLDPVEKNPFLQVAGKGKYQIYPKLPSVGEVWYMKRPLAPKYAYTQTGRVPTYDPSTSVQLEWDESNINKIIFKALQFLGVSLSDDKITEYSTIKDNQAV